MDENVNATPQLERRVARRALLKAGWIIPAIMVVGVPRAALAKSGSDATPTDPGDGDVV